MESENSSVSSRNNGKMKNQQLRLAFVALAAVVAILTGFLLVYMGSASHKELKELLSFSLNADQYRPQISMGFGRISNVEENKPVLPILNPADPQKHSHDHNQEIRFVLRESSLGGPAFVGRNILDSAAESDVYGKQGRGKSIIDDLGNLTVPQWKPLSSSARSIAIGLGLTTRKQVALTADNLQSDLPFFKGLLSSFCYTATANYDYHFYVAHDHNDPFFQTELSHTVFEMSFYSVIGQLCSKQFNVSLHLVECNHTGHPAWAQNDAMMAAYMDNMEYYYRLNDDTIMESSGWTEKLIEELERYSPPKVGVVGPWFKEGNYQILTHDFVHKTHIDIFGYYYPRVFTDWFADNWITGVYSPKRCRKAPGTRVKHTMEQGSRYVVHFDKAEKVDVEVKIGKQVIERWIKARSEAQETASIFPASSNIIVSMSLYGSNIDKLYGAIRYSQLMSVMYPQWQLRFYIQNFTNTDSSISQALKIVVRKLELSGAEIVRVDSNLVKKMHPSLWRYLVADDLSVEKFIIRDSDTRPSEREASVLADWLRSSNATWHCIRDNPMHASKALVPALVGGSPKKLQSLFTQPWRNLMMKYDSDFAFLQNEVWPVVKSHSLCHDSVSCLQWPSTRAFPVLRKDNTFVGQRVDANDEVLDKTDTMLWNWTYTSPECVFLKDTGFSEAAVKTVIAHRPVFWSQEYHITPIMDIRSLLTLIGVKFVDNSLSNYCNTVGTCAKNLKTITHKNGLSLPAEIIEEFYQMYKNDSDMQKVTTFVCTFPIAMCEAFLKFNKSMIIIATTRYEHGRSEPERWMKLNAFLKEMYLKPNVVIAANNMYDIKYIEYFTGMKPWLLPNYCAYLSATYTPKRREFLVSPIHSTELSDSFFNEFDNAVLKQNVGDLTVFPLREMYPQYLFNDLAAHKGIIYIPYQVSMVSLTEHYRMNIPLFFPSLDLLTRWHLKYQVVRQKSWNGYHNHRSNSSAITGVQHGIPDPNNDMDEEAVKYWLQFADYYRWPHITYYDSVSDLVTKLTLADLKQISQKMNEHNSLVRNFIKQTWSRVLLKITVSTTDPS